MTGNELQLIGLLIISGLLSFFILLALILGIDIYPNRLDQNASIVNSKIKK